MSAKESPEALDRIVRSKNKSLFPKVQMPRVRRAKQGRAAHFPALAHSSLLGASDSRDYFLPSGTDSNTDMQRFLLAECLQAYSDLDPGEWERLQQLLVTEKYKEGRQMTLTYYERGMIQGELRAVGDSVILLLENKFRPLPDEVKQRVETLSLEELRTLLVAILHAQTLEELGLVK